MTKPNDMNQSLMNQGAPPSDCSKCVQPAATSLARSPPPTSAATSERGSFLISGDFGRVLSLGSFGVPGLAGPTSLQVSSGLFSCPGVGVWPRVPRLRAVRCSARYVHVHGASAP